MVSLGGNCHGPGNTSSKVLRNPGGEEHYGDGSPGSLPRKSLSKMRPKVLPKNHTHVRNLNAKKSRVYSLEKNYP